MASAGDGRWELARGVECGDRVLRPFRTRSRLDVNRASSAVLALRVLVEPVAAVRAGLHAAPTGYSILEIDCAALGADDLRLLTDHIRPGAAPDDTYVVESASSRGSALPEPTVDALLVMLRERVARADAQRRQQVADYCLRWRRAPGRETHAAVDRR